MPNVKSSRASLLTTKVTLGKSGSKKRLTIMPGDNDVTAEQLTLLDADPVVRAWKAEGWLSYDAPVADPAKASK